MAGYIFAPLAGAFVATSIAYSLRNDIRVDAHKLADCLRDAKETIEESDRLLTTGKTDAERLASRPVPASYTRTPQPSLSEEIKARWNEHLTTFVRSASQVNLYESAERAYKRIRGIAEDEIKPALESAASSLGTVKEDVVSGTLRPPVAAKVDPRLHQPNTYYLGQGTSLR